MSSDDAVLGDPAWLPHRIDISAATMRFIRVARGDHAAVTFLSDEYLGSRETVDLPLQRLAGLAGQTGRAPALLLHSGFCCSTLAARALDVPGTSIGLQRGTYYCHPDQCAPAK